MASNDEAGQARSALDNCLTQLRALVAAGQIKPAALERLEQAMGVLSAAAVAPPDRAVTARVSRVPTTPGAPTPPAIRALRGV